MPKTKKELTLNLGLLLAVASWGSTFFLVKDTVASVQPIVLVAYRFIGSAVVLGLILLILRHKLFKNFKMGLVLGLFLWLIYVPQTIGLKYTSSSNSAFITGLFVVFVPIFALLIFESLPPVRKVLATVLSLAGLWVLTGGLRGMGIGDLITLITAAAVALHIIYTDRFVKNGINVYVMSFQQFLTVGVLSIIISFAMRDSFMIGSTRSGLTILYLILIPTIGAYVMQTMSQRQLDSTKTALIFSLEPAFAAVFAWTVGGELFSPKQAIGGLLIVAGIIIAEIKLKRTSISNIPI